MARPELEQEALLEAAIKNALGTIPTAHPDAPAESPEALEAAVRAYARAMRTTGEYPEKMLVAVKTAVREMATPVLSEGGLNALVSYAAQWAITAYFADDVNAGTTS